MASESQIAANQCNAQKSTGPNTPEGKEISRRNALKHGMYSGSALLLFEDCDAFEIARQKVHDHFKPVGEFERILTDRIFHCAWRVARAIGYEQTFVMDDTVRVLSTALFAPGESKPPTSYDFNDAVRKHFESGLYDKILRYEMRSERSFYRAAKHLQRLQKRRLKTQNPPETSEPSEMQIAVPALADAKNIKSEGTNPISTGSAGILPACPPETTRVIQD